MLQIESIVIFFIRKPSRNASVLYCGPSDRRGDHVIAFIFTFDLTLTSNLTFWDTFLSAPLNHFREGFLSLPSPPRCGHSFWSYRWRRLTPLSQKMTWCKIPPNVGLICFFCPFFCQNRFPRCRKPQRGCCFISLAPGLVDPGFDRHLAHCALHQSYLPCLSDTAEY